MPNSIAYQFAAVAIFVVVGALFVVVNMELGRLLRPRRPDDDKAQIYECGEPTIGTSWIRYNVRFYMLALIFLIFDVEVVFLLPVAAVLRWFADHGMGMLAFVEILLFVGVLVVGIIYAWRYGHLDWIQDAARPAGTGDGEVDGLLNVADREDLARLPRAGVSGATKVEA